MKNAPVRHAVEFGAFALFQGAVRALPHPASRALGGALGALAGRLDRRRRRTADQNLAAAFPELAGAERTRITRDCFRHFGASFCDALSSLRFTGPELLARLELVGWENFARAASSWACRAVRASCWFFFATGLPVSGEGKVRVAR